VKRKGWRGSERVGYNRTIGPLSLGVWCANGRWWFAVNGGASASAKSPEGAAAKAELKAAKLFAKWLAAT